MKYLLAGFLTLCAVSVRAETHVDTPIFECQMRGGAKVLSVGYNAPFVFYSFGSPDQAELVIKVPVTELEVRPWNGIGRYLFEGATFENDGHGYVVHHALDRLTQNAALEGGVIVMKGDAVLADLACDAGTVQGGMFAFADLKDLGGQCWDLEAQVWSTQCGDE